MLEKKTTSLAFDYTHLYYTISCVISYFFIIIHKNRCLVDNYKNRNLSNTHINQKIGNFPNVKLCTQTFFR